MSTLLDLVNYLPKVLSRRYDEPFWVNAANKVLNDIEKKRDLPRIKEEFGIVLKDRTSNYPIPAYVRKVLKVLRAPGSGSVMSNKDTLDFQLRGGYIELRENFNFDEEAEVANGVVKAGSDQLTILSDEFTDQVEHYLLTMTSGANEGYTRIISRYNHQLGVTPENTAVMKRPFPNELLAGETFTVHEAYVMVEYIVGFERAVDFICDIVADEDVQIVLQDGLRYYGENQTDEESEFGVRWERIYTKALREYTNYKGRGLFKPKAKFEIDLQSMRGEPSRLYGNTSGIYGDKDAQG